MARNEGKKPDESDTADGSQSFRSSFRPWDLTAASVVTMLEAIHDALTPSLMVNLA